jgi:hypothetical protein
MIYDNIMFFDIVDKGAMAQRLRYIREPQVMDLGSIRNLQKY